jgi:hypothetical protein
MAHANLHLAVGLAVGTAATAWPVLRALTSPSAPLARPLARMWMVSLAVGVWALIPNLVSAAGLTAGLHHAAWGDLFVGHRTIDSRIHGGLLIGQLALVAQLAVHYLILVWAVRRAGRAAPPVG